jgi:hypothetical protein
LFAPSAGGCSGGNRLLHSVQAKTAVMTTAPPNNAKKPGVSPLNIKTQRGLSKGSIPLIREQARAEQWRAAMPYSIYGMPSWNMPSIRMIDTVVGLVGVGAKKTKGMPIIAVKRCPNSIPLDLDWSSARPVVTNMDAKNTPANKARQVAQPYSRRRDHLRRIRQFPVKWQLRL